MRPVFAWLIGLLNIAVAALFAFVLSADWSEFLHGDYARAYSGSCLLDLLALCAAVGTCTCLVLRRAEGYLFQRAVAWALLLRYVWDCFLESVTLGERFSVANDWQGLLIWGTVIALALLSSRSLRRSNPATAHKPSAA